MSGRVVVALLSVVLLSGAVGLAVAEPEGASARWWEERGAGEAIHYPHELHKEVMREEGDDCLLCHTFAGNRVVEEKRLRPLARIANEPLKAICHDCHLDDLRGPWRCDLCHLEPRTIWPEDHNHDYLRRHGEDAKGDERACRTCHVDLAFCSDCHFRRQAGERRVHPLGYQSRHGIDARMSPAGCGRCHNAFYCGDCHRNRK